MNWTEPRKSYKSSQQAFSASKKIQTTCLNTPIFDKQYKSSKYQPSSIIFPTHKSKNCPYHFNSQQHVCLTCRKSVCLRCAITYCQNHTIKSQKEIIPLLIQDLQKIHIKQKIQEIQTKLSQSSQRQQYHSKKLLNIIQKVQQNFSQVIQKLLQKKRQIIEFFEKEIQSIKLEYIHNDEFLKRKIDQMKQIDREYCKGYLNRQYERWQNGQIDDRFSIQKIDEILRQINEDKCMVRDKSREKQLLQNKQRRGLWTQQQLQKVLYQIENIKYKMDLKEEGSVKTVDKNTGVEGKTREKKKRVATQSSENGVKLMQSVVHKSPVVKGLKESGRHAYNKFNSGRKVLGREKGERGDRSELL